MSAAKQSSVMVGSKRQRSDDVDQLHFGNDEAADVLAHAFMHRPEAPEDALARSSSAAYAGGPDKSSAAAAGATGHRSGKVGERPAAAANESSSAAGSTDAAEGRNFIAESYIVTIITREPVMSAPDSLVDDFPGSSDLSGANIHELSERICIKKMQNLTRLEMLLTMGAYKGAGYENTSAASGTGASEAPL